ncbi:hypothetical protein BS78_03G176700 [Paspalum vaginatum]|nr:hypothetical protein BS78_03G176700 [Paspalum vaginatum]
MAMPPPPRRWSPPVVVVASRTALVAVPGDRAPQWLLHPTQRRHPHTVASHGILSTKRGGLLDAICKELISAGHQIQITVCTTPPPLISYICASSPNTDPTLIFAEEPVVGCVNGDLLFLRVYSVEAYDLVDQAGGRPSLKLIPDTVVSGQVYLHSLRTIACLRRGHRAGSNSFYVCGLDRHIDFRHGHMHLCLYDIIDGDGKITTILHSTEKVITLDDEQGIVAFGDLARGIVICNVLADGKPASYLPLPPDLIDHNRKGCSLLNRDIAIINGLLTVVRLRTSHDSDTGCWSWDLSKWTKPVAGLEDDNKEGWHQVCMVHSDDVSVYDNTHGVHLLPKLEDANVVYVMGKGHFSDEKAVVLTVDMANKRLLMISVYDAERIINDFDYAYTPATISQYLIQLPQAICTNTWALCFVVFNCLLCAGVKGNLKRPRKIDMQYPHKRKCEIAIRMDATSLNEPLLLDGGFDMETKDKTEDMNNPMDLD